MTYHCIQYSKSYHHVEAQPRATAEVYFLTLLRARRSVEMVLGDVVRAEAGHKEAGDVARVGDDLVAIDAREDGRQRRAHRFVVVDGVDADVAALEVRRQYPRVEIG